MSTKRWTVYLLHFSRPYKHARHYLGTTPNLDERFVEHITGRGSPLVNAAVLAGIEVTVARTWKSGGRSRERRLKNSHNVPRLCPICQGKPAHPSHLTGRALSPPTEAS